jgi:hypothetical protein
MSTPKFAVGEQVIVTCPEIPIYNGDHTVREILQPQDTYFDRCAGMRLRTNPPPMPHIKFGYIMEAVLPDDDGFEVIYDESCLRKKHEPGEISFKELMEEHKEPA